MVRLELAGGEAWEIEPIREAIVGGYSPRSRGLPRFPDPQGVHRWESAGQRTWVGKSYPSVFTDL